MAMPPSPSIIRTANPWYGVLFLALFTAFFAVITGLATLNLRGFGDDRGAMFWLLLVFWLAVLALACWTIKVAVHAWRYGRSTVRLDAVPVHLGDWVSGVVEGPTGLDRSVIQLSVDCVETFSRFKSQSHLRWQHLTLLDGARLDRQGHRVLVPFNALLPADGRASERDPQKHARLEWLLRVRAHGPEVDYDVSVEIPVLPAVAGAARQSVMAPREIPELPLDGLAARLAAEFDRVGNAVVMRLPFPAIRVALAALFALAAIVVAIPGLPWTAAFDADVRNGTAAVSGGLALVMILTLALSVRDIELRPDAVRFRRGLLGVGFHSTIPAPEIAAVETKSPSPDDNPQIYGVGFRTRDGVFHRVTGRRDVVAAKALARALSLAMPQSVSDGLAPGPEARH